MARPSQQEAPRTSVFSEGTAMSRQSRRDAVSEFEKFGLALRELLIREIIAKGEIPFPPRQK